MIPEWLYGLGGLVLCVLLEETFRDQAGTGYLSERSDGFRPTIKGAWTMAWQELWPVKGIRRWREKRRAERLLAELEGA